MGVFIGQIQIAVRPEGDGGDPDELTGSFTPAAEFPHIIAVDGATGYSYRFGLVGIGAARYVEQTVRAQRHRHRTAETWTAAGQQADNIMVLVLSRNRQRVFNNGGHPCS